MEINEKLEVFYGAAIGAANSQSAEIFISRRWKNMNSHAVLHLKAQDVFS